MTRNHYFYQSPKKRAAAVYAGAFAFALAMNACNNAPVLTVEPESSAKEELEIQTVYMRMAETQKPVYEIPVLETVYDAPKEHDLDEAEVKLLARLLWSSPLRDERQKKALAWVVCNRIGVAPFGETLAAVINKTEFSFLDRKAHVSEENKRIATEVLNAYYSIQDGLNVVRGIPSSGVMVQFCGDRNRYIKVLDRSFDVVWDGTAR